MKTLKYENKYVYKFLLQQTFHEKIKKLNN